MARTVKELAAEALQVQNASNLLGISLSFNKMLTDLREHVSGSHQLERHPITRLYAHKLASMAAVESVDLEMYGTIEKCVQSFAY